MERTFLREIASKLPTSRLRYLFVFGKQMSRMLGRLALPADEAVEKMSQYQGAGIDVYITAIEKPSSLCWDGDDGYDYAPFEPRNGDT
jgi:hypothetical protein